MRRTHALLVLSYLAGALTILSPCILPVLPFVFARADRPFLTSSLPLLIGLIFAFTAVAVLAGVGGAWVVQANSYGRLIAMVVFALFGLAESWLQAQHVAVECLELTPRPSDRDSLPEDAQARNFFSMFSADNQSITTDPGARINKGPGQHMF